MSPALERALGDKLTTSGGVRDALMLWGTPTALKKAGRARRIAKRSPRSAERLADAISDALKAQGVTVAGEATWGEAISDITGDLDGICDKRDRLAGKIKEAFTAHPLGEILGSMCGFASQNRLAGPGARSAIPTASPTAGVSPPMPGSFPSTGNQDAAPWHANPQGGNHRLKNALFTAAFIAIRHDPDAQAYYQRKRDEGKRHNAAVVCVARRRCNIILSMLKTQTPYQPTPTLHTT